MKTLEILIPTYGRPESASAAIESCLAVSDPRLGIRCNSNGFEAFLEKYRDQDSRLIYSCFENNQGPHRNFLYLLKSSEARFCMLMSDEDRVDPTAMKSFLDFLDDCNNSIGVISCSLFDATTNDYYNIAKQPYSRMTFDGNAFAALSLSSTYMSGICFARSGLMAMNLDKLLTPGEGNAYPHLDVAQHILLSMHFRFYTPKLVIKGREAKFGGDAHSHKEKSETTSDNKPNLNPKVYGQYARGRQFYYRENLMAKMKGELSPVSYHLGRMNFFVFFIRAILRASRVVQSESGMTLRKEARRALADARAQHELSGSLLANTFGIVLELPSPIRLAIFTPMKVAHQIFKKAYKACLVLGAFVKR